MPCLAPLLRLPDGVLEHVTSKLTASGFFALAQTCRALNAELRQHLMLWYDTSILQENLQWEPAHRRLAWLSRTAAHHGAGHTA